MIYARKTQQPEYSTTYKSIREKLSNRIFYKNNLCEKNSAAEVEYYNIPQEKKLSDRI